MFNQIFWILLASILGFGISSIFSGWLKLRRNIYLLIYIPFTLAFCVIFILSNDINVINIIIHNWYWGILGAAIASFFVIRNVLSQPSSESSKGLSLFGDILWPGFFYGFTDSLLLSIVPVLTVKELFSVNSWMDDLPGKIIFGVVALFASLMITLMYHLGYSEFRNKKVWWTAFGNGILSLAYILTMNPLATVLPHVAMHITAIIHGRNTTGQVPPHYND